LPDLHRRGLLLPGLTVALVTIAFSFAPDSGGTAWLYVLTATIGVGNIYLVHLFCGKKKPFWYLLAIAVFAFVLDVCLLKLIVLGNTTLPFPFAPALVEEPTKALPLLVVWFVGRFLSRGRQRKYGLREPLDGIALAAASATAFSLLETMIDYMPKFGPVVGPDRLVMAIYGHIAYSAILGYYFGLAALHHRQPLRVAVSLILGFFLAGALHDLWDLTMFFPQNVLGVFILEPLDLIVIGIASIVVMASMIVKGREVSPEREFLWPYGSIPPYSAPLVRPLPEMPPLSGDRWLAIDAKRFRLVAGASLTNQDIPCLVAAGVDGVVAQALPHPSDREVLVLRNLSRSTWEAVRVDGSVRAVAPAETIRLIPGTRIDFGTLAGAVLLTPHDASSDLASKTETEAERQSG
jgi:RsiW-degrading membrane proteinase PrsW (M82 family)